jgi:hypothetical protein
MRAEQESTSNIPRLTRLVYLQIKSGEFSTQSEFAGSQAWL